ncbi:type IV pilus biogenesis/stability protein PilW [Methylocucumis oryzae]|uniref:type IV pilus biogenesis/stability protein PilW n=1 Tax=Methylocucumis oryzae TaxID=1632867 RepID=UPI001EF9C9AA|nr:type IV pilus biogenesis/stability protein PilW [Methylocucumis oryzae]
MLATRGLILCAVLTLSTGCSLFEKKKDENSADIYVQLGIRYLNMNRLEVAKENLELALKEEPNNMQAHNALAFLFEKIEKYPEAEEQYDIALNLKPDDLGVQNNYGRFLCDRKKYDQGMALLTKAIANLLNDRPWLALTNAGICQLGLGQKQKAKAYFKQALNANASYAPALLEMQKFSYRSGEYWPAKAFFAALFWLSRPTRQKPYGTACKLNAH